MSVSDPIHKPCPDMAGMVNPDPELAQKSRVWVARLLGEVRRNKTPKRKTVIPARFRQKMTL